MHNREHSKHNAYRQLQLDIMQNCAILSPDYLTPKDIVGMSMDIEKFLKENPDANGEGRSNLDLMADFLRGGELATEQLAEDDTEQTDSSVRII